MAVKAQVIIDAALITELAVYSPDETPSTNDRNTGLLILNRIVSQANTRSRFLFVHDILSFTIGTAAASYTIGPSGATFTAARPTKITRANLIRTADTPDTRTPLEVIEIGEFANIQDYLDTAIEPMKLFYRPTMPSGTIYLLPYSDGSTESLADKLELFVDQPVSAFADLNTTSYDLAPGYEDWLTLALAKRLARSFDKVPSQELVDDERTARSNITALNLRSPRMTTIDSGMPGSR
jgi:hypothetical protein